MDELEIPWKYAAEDLNFNYVIEHLVCTENDVLNVLSSIDVKKASGPVNISPRILKECAKELAPSLAQLVNYSLFIGKLPTDWKITNVVPVYKSDKQSFADKYRPISMTSIVVKTMKRIIRRHFVDIFLSHTLLSENQHGFKQSRSCITQLLELLHYWFSFLDNRGAIDVIIWVLPDLLTKFHMSTS